MKKGISKNRPKGAEYGRIKSHEKLARKLEDKKRVGQIENAKKNAVRRKEKEAKKNGVTGKAIGGVARAAKLTDEERHEIAKKLHLQDGGKRILVMGCQRQLKMDN